MNTAWGCNIQNQPPELSEIVSTGNYYTGEEYIFSAAITEPNGGSVTYSWSVSGGNLANPNTNPVKWTIPATEGVYQITVEVDDGKRGSDSRTKSVEVLPMLGPPIAAMEIPIIYSEGGWVREDGFVGKP